MGKMADYPLKASPVGADLIDIVDVEDTSASPQGTTKRITIGSLPAGGGGSGTVTSVSVVSANGLAGSVANPTTTPALTLSTTISGLLKGVTGALAAATAGTDYLAPAGNGSQLTGLTQTQISGLVAALALLAPLASPALTGTPTAPTAVGGTNTTQLATTAFVQAAVPAALPPNGSASGDLSGSYPGPTVAKVQGVAITAAQATLVSDLNNATVRNATATLLPGEETVFTGSTAAQTLTLPASPPSSSVNTVTNTASVSVTLAPGAGATLSNFGTSGNITVPAGYMFAVVYIGTTWYVQAAGPSDFATSSALAVANGGTGQVTRQAALDALAGAVTASQVLAGNGTHVTLRALASGDIPDLAYVDTVSAGDSSVTVTGATDTPSIASVPAQLVQRMYCV